MKKILLATLLGAAAFSANAQVGVSINVGEPNFYGSINIGNYPPPQVINTQPIIAAPAVGVVVGAPLYMRVPVEHQRDWRRYCGIYNACGRPVYFVHEDWYNKVYAPHYRAEHGRDEHRHDEGRHEEERHDEERGHHDHDEH